MESDLRIEWHGSVTLLYGESDCGREWIDTAVAECSDEPVTWCGGLVVEPRYLAGLVQQAINDGLVVQGGQF